MEKLKLGRLCINDNCIDSDCNLEFRLEKGKESIKTEIEIGCYWRSLFANEVLKDKEKCKEICKGILKTIIHFCPFEIMTYKNVIKENTIEFVLACYGFKLVAILHTDYLDFRNKQMAHDLILDFLEDKEEVESKEDIEDKRKFHVTLRNGKELLTISNMNLHEIYKMIGTKDLVEIGDIIINSGDILYIKQI